ncbi:MAG: hypothetical protein S4CHLAM7_02070 [Chlamydiae bacterium]|nr:hypothetical protein [Chlamydiota bacterium]
MNIKRAWLAMLWIGVISSIAIFVVATFFLGASPTYASIVVLSKLKALKPNSSFIKLIIEIIIAVPISYFCSYKKPGTKLLFCSILWSCICIATLLMAIFSALSIFFEVRNMELLKQGWNLRAICFVMGALTFTTLWRIGWLYCCVKLRKYNFKLRYQQVWQNPTYKEYLDRFQKINDMEKLRVFYSFTVRECPEIEKFLTCAFKKKESQLNGSEDILEV